MKSDVYDNRQDTDTTWVSTGGWVGKEEVVCSTQRSPSRPQGKKEPCSLPQNRWAERALCEVRQARQRKTKLSRCLLHVESQTQTWNNPGSQIRKTARGWRRAAGRNQVTAAPRRKRTGWHKAARVWHAAQGQRPGAPPDPAQRQTRTRPAGHAATRHTQVRPLCAHKAQSTVSRIYFN